jgi:hypothetical protein
VLVALAAEMAAMEAAMAFADAPTEELPFISWAGDPHIDPRDGFAGMGLGGAAYGTLPHGGLSHGGTGHGGTGHGGIAHGGTGHRGTAHGGTGHGGFAGMGGGGAGGGLGHDARGYGEVLNPYPDVRDTAPVAGFPASPVQLNAGQRRPRSWVMMLISAVVAVTLISGSAGYFVLHTTAAPASPTSTPGIDAQSGGRGLAPSGSSSIRSSNPPLATGAPDPSGLGFAGITSAGSTVPQPESSDGASAESSPTDGASSGAARPDSPGPAQLGPGSAPPAVSTTTIPAPAPSRTAASTPAPPRPASSAPAPSTPPPSSPAPTTPAPTVTDSASTAPSDPVPPSGSQPPSGAITGERTTPPQLAPAG